MEEKLCVLMFQAMADKLGILHHFIQRVMTPFLSKTGHGDFGRLATSLMTVSHNDVYMNGKFHNDG